jgi:hypothetical protein
MPKFCFRSLTQIQIQNSRSVDSSYYNNDTVKTLQISNTLSLNLNHLKYYSKNNVNISLVLKITQLLATISGKSFYFLKFLL